MQIGAELAEEAARVAEGATSQDLMLAVQTAAKIEWGEGVFALLAAIVAGDMALHHTTKEDRVNMGRTALKTWDRTLDDVQELWPHWFDVEHSLSWAKAFNGGHLPVKPAETVSLKIKSGELPTDLAGNFLRIGPNPLFWPPRKRTHVFDGDGMIHSVRIVNGSATYSSQWLETPRLKFEKEFGEEWFPRIGEYQSFWGLAKTLLSSTKIGLSTIEEWEAAGVANTAITYTPDGRLWALHETSPPFRFRLDKDGRVESIGYDTLEGTHRSPMSAHPKIDYHNEEIYFHGREMMKSFSIAKVKDNKVVDKVDLDMPTGFHHDFIMTENYIVVIDGSVHFNPNGVVDGSNLWRFNKNSNLRFGVIPRNATKMTHESISWIQASEPAEIVHTLHAYDKDGKIILWAPMSFEADDGCWIGDLTDGCTANSMRRLELNLENKTVDIGEVEGGDKHATEFPRVRDDCVGSYCRYGYSALQSPGNDFNFTGILKWDFEESRLCNTISFPPNVVGGEPIFIPKDGGSNEGKLGDEGYIGQYLWDYAKNQSSFALFDAQSFSSTPVVELAVPHRVPIGFHAAWINEQQFQRQLSRP